jgi:hypothetical protein
MADCGELAVDIQKGKVKLTVLAKSSLLNVVLHDENFVSKKRNSTLLRT